MPTDVAERAQLAVLVAQDEDGLRAGRRGEVVAGPPKARHMGDELPAAGEDASLLELGDRGVAVVTGLQLAPALLGAGIRFWCGLERAQGVILTL
jgi:hypothetical protein